MVRDHCHNRKIFRGGPRELQSTSKGNEENSNFLHNFKGYDAHLIMQAIGKYNKNIYVVPNTRKIHCLIMGIQLSSKIPSNFFQPVLLPLLKTCGRMRVSVGPNFSALNFGKMKFHFYYVRAFIPMKI